MVEEQRLEPILRVEERSEVVEEDIKVVEHTLLQQV